MTDYYWTTDPNHSDLTGRKRIVHHVYYGYKIELDEKGKRHVFRSEKVDNIEDLPADYIYIKPDFYEKVYTDIKSMEQEDNEEIVNSENLDSKQQAEYESQTKGKAKIYQP